jgi:hypothetical protein
MELSALRSLIEAIRTKAPSRRIILFGSSSLLASFPDDPPEEIGVAVTLDADFFIEPDDLELRKALADELGEDHAYHRAHGYYGDFVDLRLADAFPEGWRERLVPMPGFDHVAALHPLDMAVSKVGATARSRLDVRFGRRKADRGMKDIHTLVALIKTGRMSFDELSCRVFQMDYEPALIAECGRVVDKIRELTGAAA